MLLFGNNVSYASHLPMFHHPHDYQLIMKLRLSDNGSSETLAQYDQLKTEGFTLFTLLPEVMDLSKIIDGSKTSFQASIFDGHFERGGSNLEEVTVEVEEIIFSQRLKSNQDSTDLQNYLVFGSTPEYFAAHLIKAKPNFDAILSVSQPFKLEIQSCNRDSCPEPVEVPVLDSELPLNLDVLNTSGELALPEEGSVLGTTLEIQARVKTVIYLEEDELSF